MVFVLRRVFVFGLLFWVGVDWIREILDDGVGELLFGGLKGDWVFFFIVEIFYFRRGVDLE